MQCDMPSTPSRFTAYCGMTKPTPATPPVTAAPSFRRQPIAAQRARNVRMMEQAVRMAQAATPSDVDHVIPVAMIPANTRETTMLPESSRAAFLDRLQQTMLEAFAMPMGDASTPESAASRAAYDAATASFDLTSTDDDLIVGRSCATCRGECCTAGGEHAFLRVDSIERMRRQHPEMTAAFMLQSYADMLPERHYRGSCVYHTTDGCALPREMRSNLCNRYICGGLTQLRKAMHEHNSPSVFVAAADSVHLRRVALIDAHSSRAISLEQNSSS